jgi:hypothetical protein
VNKDKLQKFKQLNVKDESYDGNKGNDSKIS